MSITEQHQLYFWAFIVAIVAMMKYIDIEISQQLVTMPIAAKFEEQVKNVVQTDDAAKEKTRSEQFAGFLIPPIEQAGERRDVDKLDKPLNTKILREFKKGDVV